MKSKGIQKLYACFGQCGDEVSSEWSNGMCPLAPYTHEGGVDAHPSFGIRVNETGESLCKCYTCGFFGTVSDLVFRLLFFSRKQPGRVNYNLMGAMQLIADDIEDTPGVVYKAIAYEEESEIEIVFPQTWLDSFFPIVQHPYLIERGVSEAIAKVLNIRLDVIDGRICFPIVGANGRLLGLHGRTFIGSNLIHKYYRFLKRCNHYVLGNENNVSLDIPVVLTEGWFDLARIIEVYPNCLCTMTSSISFKKLDRLYDVENIISFYDFGTGGDNARNTLDKYCGQRGIDLVHIILTEQQGDAGNMVAEEIKKALQEVGLQW